MPTSPAILAQPRSSETGSMERPGKAETVAGRFKGHVCRLRPAQRPAGSIFRGWRRRADSNRRMRVLQTLALPLGHVALEGGKGPLLAPALGKER